MIRVWADIPEDGKDAHVSSKIGNYIGGPSKGCQLNPKGWRIEYPVTEPFGTPLKVLMMKLDLLKSANKND